jgi:cytochrome c oxidase cbb3-type subunit 4
MDVNDLRILTTVLTFVTFVGIVAWVYSGRRKKHYEAAARMAIDDDQPIQPERSHT